MIFYRKIGLILLLSMLDGKINTGPIYRNKIRSEVVVADQCTKFCYQCIIFLSGFIPTDSRMIIKRGGVLGFTNAEKVLLTALNFEYFFVLIHKP